MDFPQNSYYQEHFTKLSGSGDAVLSRVFEECEFNNCSFIECKFNNCKFLRCKFTGCDLTALSLTNSQLLDVSFSGCKLMGIDWTKTQKLTGLKFSECRLNYSNFKLLILPKIEMANCEVKEAGFNEADLNNGDFKNTDFEKSVFFKTNLTNADFKGAKNYSIDVKNNILKKTRFSLPEALSLLEGLDIIIE